MANNRQLSRSKGLAEKLIYAALSILHGHGKEMPMRDVISRVEQEVDLNDWDKERYEKSGYIRWESILHFYSIDCVKAGYLIKKKGNRSRVQGSTFRVKDKDGIEDLKSSSKMLIFPNNHQFGSKCWISPDEADAFLVNVYPKSSPGTRMEP